MANSKQDPIEKRYYSKIPGSVYTFADGHQIQFLHGRFDFKPSEYQDTFFVAPVNNQASHPMNGKTRAEAYFSELEYLVNTGNPLIFQQGSNPVESMPEGLNPAKNALSEAELAAAEQKLKGIGLVTRETGDVNAGPVSSDVNSSAIDKDLQNVILRTAAVGPGASKAEQIRAAAAERAQAAAAATGGTQANNSN